MSNVLKKVHINPLRHFELDNEVAEYEQIQDDSQLAAFYHNILTRFENHPLIVSFVYAMIGFSTDKPVTNLINEVEELI